MQEKGEPRPLGVTFTLYALTIFSWLATECGCARAAPGVSPGPAGFLSGEDHRVQLKWLEKPGIQYGGGNYGRHLLVDDRQRYYEVHVPSQYDGRSSLPVVLVLHGGGGYATLMRSTTGMDRLSEQEGFIVAYLAGTSATTMDRRLFWNVGYPTKDPGQSKVDDVGYVARVLDDLPNYFAIDKRRVYATGISNGGMMTYRLAVELADRIAAIASVAGQRSLDEFPQLPSRPISVMHLHGRRDTWCPYEGGQGKAGRAAGQFLEYEQPAVERAIETWVRFNRCTESPTVRQVRHARELRYDTGRDDTEVTLWTLDDGGHTWPGGNTTRFARRQGVGNINRDISASQAMWEFFQRHTLPEPSEP